MVRETKEHQDSVDTAGELIAFLQRFPADAAIEFYSEGREIRPYIEESYAGEDEHVTLAFVQD